MVEFQPSKLAVVGSNPIARSKRRREASTVIRKACGRQGQRPELRLTIHEWRMTSCDAHVAQLVEHVLGKDEVTRSIRVVGSRRGSVKC